MGDTQPTLSIRTVVIGGFYLIVGSIAVAFLYDLYKAELAATQLPRNGTIPVLILNESAIEASMNAMMPLMPSDGSLVTYVQATAGCNAAYFGKCTNVRTGPGVEFPSVLKLRDGVILRVEKTVRVANRDWYKITFDEYVRYPDRLGKDLYVASDAVTAFLRAAPKELDAKKRVDTKKIIIVDVSEQKLYAYNAGELYMAETVSTGLDGTPTEVGQYRIFRKTPSRYMQGPIPGGTDDEYDLPGVPWTMYFTVEGAAIHGAYWHNNFGNQHSHGCVNLTPEKARILYEWADLGTPVLVRE